jgi:hypothetical protein
MSLSVIETKKKKKKETNKLSSNGLLPFGWMPLLSLLLWSWRWRAMIKLRLLELGPGIGQNVYNPVGFITVNKGKAWPGRTPLPPPPPSPANVLHGPRRENPSLTKEEVELEKP